MISDEYRAVLEATHALYAGWGNTDPAKWGPTVTDLAIQTGSASIVDYGCGKGRLSTALEAAGFDVTRYDPATYPGDPAPADLVVCLDVMEHVEPEHVDAVLEHIAWLARRAAYLVISLEPAVKVLTDGRNAHLTIWPADAWLGRLARYFDRIEILPHPTGGRALCVAAYPAS